VTRISSAIMRFPNTGGASRRALCCGERVEAWGWREPPRRSQLAGWHRCCGPGRTPGWRPAILGAVRSPNRAALAALVAEATVDCYNDSKCVTGFYTMLDEHLELPFQTSLLGTEVTVSGIDLADEHIVVICARGRSRQRIPILDLPLPTPPPAGAQWIEAYRHWLRYVRA
jgi:hypothetical protein